MSFFCRRSYWGPSLLSGAILLATDAHRVSAAGPPSFQGLGALPGSQFGSSARAISDDGTAVTGNSDQSGIDGSFFMAYRWQAGVMIPLGDLPGSSDLSEAGGISADGSVAGGMSFSSNNTEAFRWEGGVMTGLGDLPGGAFYSHAFDVSGDGSAVVGLSRTHVADFPFRWKDGVMINLSDGFAGGSGAGYARAISYDGNTVVGQISTNEGIRPFRWHNGVMEALDIPEDSQSGVARAVSPDGTIVVGDITHGTSPELVMEAFRWEAGQLILLGDLPGGSFQSRAEDVSADGSVIVGNSQSASAFESGFIWTPAGGMRRLRDVLEQDFNLDLTGWNLGDAAGVSADGLTMTGTGTGPSGQQEAWLAHIGCAIAGDFNNNGVCDGGDIAGFIRCVITGLGCGCGDQDGDQVVDLLDVGPFVACLLNSLE